MTISNLFRYIGVMLMVSRSADTSQDHHYKCTVGAKRVADMVIAGAKKATATCPEIEREVGQWAEGAFNFSCDSHNLAFFSRELPCLSYRDSVLKSLSPYLCSQNKYQGLVFTSNPSVVTGLMARAIAD